MLRIVLPVVLSLFALSAYAAAEPRVNCTKAPTAEYKAALDVAKDVLHADMAACKMAAKAARNACERTAKAKEEDARADAQRAREEAVAECKAAQAK